MSNKWTDENEHEDENEQSPAEPEIMLPGERRLGSILTDVVNLEEGESCIVIRKNGNIQVCTNVEVGGNIPPALIEVASWIDTMMRAHLRPSGKIFNEERN